jgi:hypothetical protein
MTPKQIKQMRDTAIAFLSIILCYGIVYIAIEFERHKSAYKLTRHAIIHQTIK